MRSMWSLNKLEDSDCDLPPPLYNLTLGLLDCIKIMQSSMNFVQNLSLYFKPVTQMLTSNQGFREIREGSSPFREKYSKRDTTFDQNHSQSSNNGLRTRYDMLDPQSKVSDRSNNSKTQHIFRQNTNIPLPNEERHHISSYKPKRQHQNYSFFNEYDYDNPHKKNSMNDFSFQAEFGHHVQQDNHTSVRRENARMKALEVKMNNIESLNEKINNLLSMVKRDKSKDRSKDKLQSSQRAYSKKIMDNVKEKMNQNMKRGDMSPSQSKNKENSYNCDYNDTSQRQKTGKYSIKPRKEYIPQKKNTPLCTKEQDMQKKPSYTKMIHQKKSKNQLLDKEAQQNQISYSPPPRNRRRTATINEYKQEQSHQQVKKQQNRQVTPPSTRKERVNIIQQMGQKSIQDMINERRIQINMKQQQKNQRYQLNFAKESERSNRNTQRIEKQSQYTIEQQKNIVDCHNHIKERMVKLTTNIRQNENVKPEERSSLTGRIYKKNQIKTPLRASYTYKQSLELDQNLF